MCYNQKDVNPGAVLICFITGSEMWTDSTRFTCQLQGTSRDARFLNAATFDGESYILYYFIRYAM